MSRDHWFLYPIHFYWKARWEKNGNLIFLKNHKNFNLKEKRNKFNFKIKTIWIHLQTVSYFKRFTFTTSFKFTLVILLHNIWGMVKCNWALKSCCFCVVVLSKYLKNSWNYLLFTLLVLLVKKSWNVKKSWGRSNLGSVRFKG